MASPISRIGGQRAVTRDAGSDGHDQVARTLDGNDPRAKAATPARNKKVEEVAKMYERQFLGEMFKAMRSTVTETDKPSMAQGIYNSQRDEQYLDAWSEKGGVGFSNIIYDQVMERFFGQTPGGHALKQQGMIPITNREITKVSQVKDGVATPIVPNAVAKATTGFDETQAAKNLIESVDGKSPASESSQTKISAAKPGIPRTFESTEPMPAPTPPKIDTRTMDERVAAGELFPETATAREPNQRAPSAAEGQESPNSPNSLSSLNSPSNLKTQSQTENSNSNSKTSLAQTALQIEVRPSPTGSPAKIQAPWDATVITATRLDGARTAVTLEHGQGLRSTLVFDGVLSAQATPGQKIPRGESIATLNQDAKSFLWNLAPQPQTSGQRESRNE